MAYSCTDFTDSILDALGIEVPEESWDSPSDQADLALAEIERLQRSQLSTREMSTVLAALRYWQREGWRSEGHEHAIANNGGEITPLSHAEIDDLCERLNMTEDPNA